MVEGSVPETALWNVRRAKPNDWAQRHGLGMEPPKCRTASSSPAIPFKGDAQAGAANYACGDLITHPRAFRCLRHAVHFLLGMPDRSAAIRANQTLQV